MAFDFPSSPTEGQIFATPSGLFYQYTAPYWLVIAPDMDPPLVSSYSPADNATDVTLISPLVVTFNKAVTLGTGTVTLKKTSDNSIIESWNVVTEAGTGAGQVSASGFAMTLRTTLPLQTGIQYYVIWEAGVVKDAINNDVAAQSSTTEWSFTAIASLDLDLTNPATAAQLTCIRAGEGWADNLAGTWIRFAADTPRITDKGLLLEISRGNICRWSRDLTQSTWIKTNMTAAKDQTGVDGVANSASSITATAAAATITSTTAVTTSSRLQSAFVKRLAGSGTIEMSANGAANVQTITVSSSWTRVYLPVITAASPTVYFRIATSGDSIAVDFAQNETNIAALTGPTSPIETGSAALTRNEDLITVTPTAYGIPGGPSLAMFVQAVPLLAITYAITQEPLVWDDGTNSNRVILRRNLTTGNATSFNVVGGTNTGLTGTSIGTAWAEGVRGKAALSVDTGAQAATKDGGAGVTGSSATPQIALSTLRIGNASAGATPWHGLIERVTIYPASKTLTELQTMTT